MSGSPLDIGVAIRIKILKIGLLQYLILHLSAISDFASVGESRRASISKKQNLRKKNCLNSKSFNCSRIQSMFSLSRKWICKILKFCICIRGVCDLERTCKSLEISYMYRESVRCACSRRWTSEGVF
jgi:hypothetical protein